MRSAWICTHNDVFGNLAVLVAAGFRDRAGWPDVIVAMIMAGSVQGSTLVIQQALGELRHGKLMTAA